MEVTCNDFRVCQAICQQAEVSERFCKTRSVRLSQRARSNSGELCDGENTGEGYKKRCFEPYFELCEVHCVQEEKTQHDPNIKDQDVLPE